MNKISKARRNCYIAVHSVYTDMFFEMDRLENKSYTSFWSTKDKNIGVVATSENIFDLNERIYLEEYQKRINNSEKMS